MLLKVIKNSTKHEVSRSLDIIFTQTFKDLTYMVSEKKKPMLKLSVTTDKTYTHDIYTQMIFFLRIKIYTYNRNSNRDVVYFLPLQFFPQGFPAAPAACQPAEEKKYVTNIQIINGFEILTD